jgi:hypothetical protein
VDETKYEDDFESPTVSPSTQKNVSSKIKKFMINPEPMVKPKTTKNASGKGNDMYFKV